jgi:hypothetical protein
VDRSSDGSWRSSELYGRCDQQPCQEGAGEATEGAMGACRARKGHDISVMGLAMELVRKGGYGWTVMASMT